MNLHILQISISGLIPIIYMSYSLQKYVYFYILLGNLCISLYVHRKNRLEKKGIEDYLDIGFITIWVIKNTYEIILIIYTTTNLLFTVYILFVALINVYNCYVFDNLRLKYKWRSNKNIEYHINMHTSSILGTYVLIINSNY